MELNTATTERCDIVTLHPFSGLTLYKAPATGFSNIPVPEAADYAARDRLPTGTITLLFSDIESSTRLLRHLGSDEYARILGIQRRILRTAYRSWNGTIVDTAGDGCFAVFQSAKSAVCAAVAAQRALAAHPWPEGVQVRVRMGIHTGEPSLFDEGYVGLDVHLAARICAVARGGQILLSRTTRELVERATPPGLNLLDKGFHRLKDMDRLEQLSEIEDVALQPSMTAQNLAIPAEYEMAS